VPYLKVTGKGDKIRYVELHPGTNALIHDYLEAAGHGADDDGPLFRPIRNNRTGELEKALTPDMIYKLVRGYSAQLGFEIGAHACRATAGTNALENGADIAKVKDWFGQPFHNPALRSPQVAAGRQPGRSRWRIEMD
jgi:integrase/recombinase XerD